MVATLLVVDHELSDCSESMPAWFPLCLKKNARKAVYWSFADMAELDGWISDLSTHPQTVTAHRVDYHVDFL
jgi:hypothetical protein